MVEAVLVVPVLMLLLLVLVQFALWAHAAQVVQLAASDGDRTARTWGGSTGQGAARARSILSSPSSDVSSSSVVVTVLPGDLTEVSVSAHARSILPGLSLPVSATQVGPMQEFRAEALEFGNSEAHRGSNPSVSARFEAQWDPRVPRPEGYRVIER